MARLTSKIRFSALQVEILERFFRQRTVSKQLSERVEILLLSRSGMGSELISRKMGLRKGKVIMWRNRWIASQDALDALEGKDDSPTLVLEAIVGLLSDLPRSGRPREITQAQRELVVAMACETPEEHGVAREAWTHKALADTAGEEGVVERISPATVRRILKK